MRLIVVSYPKSLPQLVAYCNPFNNRLSSNSRLDLRHISFQHLFAFSEILDCVFSLEAPTDYGLSGTT